MNISFKIYRLSPTEKSKIKRLFFFPPSVCVFFSLFFSFPYLSLSFLISIFLFWYSWNFPPVSGNFHFLNNWSKFSSISPNFPWTLFALSDIFCTPGQCHTKANCAKAVTRLVCFVEATLLNPSIQFSINLYYNIPCYNFGEIFPNKMYVLGKFWVPNIFFTPARVIPALKYVCKENKQDGTMCA